MRKFKIVANCIPVKGFARSVICDLQNSGFTFIPNSLYEILQKYDGRYLEDVKKEYDLRYAKIIDQYFDFLEENNFIFWTDSIDNFPELDLEWDYPSKITNAIIDYSSSSNFSIINIMDRFNQLGVKNIQIRFFNIIAIAEIDIILKSALKKYIQHIEIIIPYSDEFDLNKVQDICYNHPRINSVILYSAPENNIILTKGIFSNIIFIQEKITSKAHCGSISPHFFSSNIFHFTEAQNYNTCLNRKIAIDTDGNIKNCPSMPQSYGNIKNTTLEEALNHPDFKKHWNINKDKIHVCKDCEFRYICTDCRAYIENPEDIYSKPLKCGYNPYTGEWSEWSTNPLKQKAIQYYGMEELIKK